jgi:propanol-preferring alcohol dehydrogenase
MATTAIPHARSSKASPTTYRAAVVHDFGSPLTLEQVRMPTLKPGQVRVKVLACGLCHTDVHAADGDWPIKPTPPFIPGHEGVGIVTELAPGEVAVGDRAHRVAVGDRVAMPWLGYACGCCNYCVSGWETLCPEQEMMGYTIDGGFGEYATAYARYVVKVPEGIDTFDAAPLTCAGVTTYKAVKVAGTRPSDFVAVFGVGGLGHLAIQYAAMAGGRVVAVDVVDEKLELARELGAEFTINARTRQSRSLSRPAPSSRPTGRCDGAGSSCSSRCRPTTRSRSRSSKPCSMGSRSRAPSSGHARTYARCSSSITPVRRA